VAFYLTSGASRLLEEKEKKAEEEEAALIKSRDPHLAGGEQAFSNLLMLGPPERLRN
jgi:hypothetical protein